MAEAALEKIRGLVLRGTTGERQGRHQPLFYGLSWALNPYRTAYAHGVKFVEERGSRELRSGGILGIPSDRIPPTYFLKEA